MTKETNKYTHEEIMSNINFFLSKENDLVNQRKEINKTISEVRKQIDYWKELDISQLKIFTS